MIYPAHILAESHTVQSVQEHCRNTADIAAARLQCINLDRAGYLAGLVHDMGKFTQQFKEYLERAVYQQKASRGRVIHTHGAVSLLLGEQFHTKECFATWEDLTAEILAYAAAAHHGLFDCIKEHNWGFSHRMNWDKTLYQQAESEFLRYCADREQLQQLFEQAHKQLEPAFFWCEKQPSSDNSDIYFHLGLLTRLILSAVIQGDREDTARFMQADVSTRTQRAPVRWDALLKRVEDKLLQLPQQTPIQRARSEISNLCRQAAAKPSSIYRLNVPTGGGKTLSSLRYALAHAAAYQKSRVIFVSPLLSILEQNAAVLREFIGDDTLILEHHSNVVQEQLDADCLDLHELMAESWDAPIIITTLVQLLHTLFLGKTSCIRRFQSLCNCVLVIDEVHTVPTKMITLFNLAINFLHGICKSTIVLCSATQPCFEETEHSMLVSTVQIDESGVYTLSEPCPPSLLVPYEERFWTVFQRTKISCADRLPLDEVPAYLNKLLSQVNSLLVICNTKKQAASLYWTMQQTDAQCFHLSTSMCAQHRRDVLAHMQQMLHCNAKVLCISTQLIEAGVDVSFACVVRMAAGMDNVVQAAGRCNRNGELDGLAPVYILDCRDEQLQHLPDIARAKDATLQLLSAFRKDPAHFSSDLSSTSSISYYYQRLYGSLPQGAQDYSIPKPGTSIYELLSVNQTYTKHLQGVRPFGLSQAFAMAGSAFQVFEQGTIDVLVPYQQGEALITELSALSGSHRLDLQKQCLDRAKPFTISIYQEQKRVLEQQGGLAPLLGGAVLALNPSFYDAMVGMTMAQGNLTYLEV